MTVLITVTHLLGTGHLSRALILARAFAAAGHQVRLVSGGMPAAQLNTDGLDLVQLPPLRSDGTNFTRLLTSDGMVASASYLDRRKAALVAALRDNAPGVLITELYPFGRRVLADEFLALLGAARNLPKRPLILSSVRDILAPPSKPEKAHRTDDVLGEFYDGVLVHSDLRGTSLDQSWPVSDRLRPLLHYTGYVAPPPAGPHSERAGEHEILVSAGGGAVGTPLFQAALAAAKANPARKWRLLVGGGDAEDRIAALRRSAPESPAVLQPARPDFRQMLYHAAASVSMCGYNTALDLLQAGTPAVLMPFDAGQEVEQGLRAQSLARLPGISLLPSSDLGAAALLQKVDTVIDEGRRGAVDLNFDGANETVRIVANLIEARS